MQLEIGLFEKEKKERKKKRKEKKRKEKKKKPNCIKSGLSQFLFLQQKMQYVALTKAIFIIK